MEITGGVILCGNSQAQGGNITDGRWPREKSLPLAWLIIQGHSGVKEEREGEGREGVRQGRKDNEK